MDVVNKSQGLGSLQFLTGPQAGHFIQISKPIVIIGRETTNDIVISDPLVSRHHAQLVSNGGQWSIEKLSSQNSLTVNHREVQQSPIADHDIIGLGPETTLRFLVSPDVSPVSLHQPTPQQSYPPQQPFAPQQPSYAPQQHQQQMPLPPPQQPYAQQQPPQQQQFAPPANQHVPAPPPVVPADGQQPIGSLASTEPIAIPSIEITSNTHPLKKSYLLNKQLITIGRDSSNSVVIDEPVVSHFHAQIVLEGNQFVIVHPQPNHSKTTNGLIYQGRHYESEQPFRKPLERGDFFRIGDEHGTIVTITYNDGSGAAQDFVPVMHPIALGAPVITMGRLPDNIVVLNHPQVSRYHARLEQAPGGYRILDLRSTHHVYVNGQRVTNQLLKPGDEIRIGPFQLIYTGTQLTQHDESSGIRIDARELYKEGNKKTILIDNISIAIPPRKFVALVGGSGAGKSTLMDALNGLRPAQKGAVYYNGKDYYEHLAAFSTQLGYVPQDDIIHRDLTVERALYYTAKMRLPGDFTREQIKQRIDEVLDEVDMKSRRKLLVSKLSGGQRKRVSIALELLADPSIFFLDEPTSGLDPGLDRKMMLLLRNLADKGRTIVLVTHATNNINSCDYVCFLAQGGCLAYFGPPNEAKTYFGKTDFAEIYSALEPTQENPNIPKEAEERFKASSQYQQYVVIPLEKSPVAQTNRLSETVEVVPPKRGNPWKQFLLLSRRYLDLLKNDVGNLLILLLQAPVIALILYLMLKPSGHGTFDPTSVFNFSPGAGGDAQKYLFIMAFAAAMFGIVNGAREIVKEVPVYRRERTVNLGILPYMFSKIVVLGLLCLLQSGILVLVVNYVAPIQQGIFLPAPLEVYITMALTSLAGLMIGLTISALAPNNDRAVSFIPIILIPQVIFSGVLFKLDGPFLQVFGSLFAVRWSMAAAGSTVGIHGDKVGSDSWTYQGTLFSTTSQLDATLHLLVCWFALVAMIFILGGLTAFFLKRKDVRHKVSSRPQGAR